MRCDFFAGASVGFRRCHILLLQMACRTGYFGGAILGSPQSRHELGAIDDEAGVLALANEAVFVRG